MNIFRCCSLLALLAATACMGLAYPSLPGPTGNAAFPTAEIVAPGALDLAIDIDDNAAYYAFPAEADYPMRALCGLARNVEAGASYNPTIIAGDDANIWSIHAKHRFPGQVAGFALASGVRFARSHSSIPVAPTVRLSGTESTIIAYVAGTRALSHNTDLPVNGTVGIHYNWQDTDFNLPGTPSTRQSVRAFFALDATVAHRLRLSAEYQTKKEEEDQQSVYAFTARYLLSSALGIEAGYSNLDPTGILGLEDGKLFAGLRYAFNVED